MVFRPGPPGVVPGGSGAVVTLTLNETEPQKKLTSENTGRSLLRDTDATGGDTTVDSEPFQALTSPQKSVIGLTTSAVTVKSVNAPPIRITAYVRGMSFR